MPLASSFCSSPAAVCAPGAALGASPGLSAAPQWPPGLPHVGRCWCGRRGTSPVCRAGILSHSSLQQLSPCFPLRDLHSLASRAVSLSFLPVLLESCTKCWSLTAALRLCEVLEGHFGPFAWIFWDSLIISLKETLSFRNGPCTAQRQQSLLAPASPPRLPGKV